MVAADAMPQQGGGTVSKGREPHHGVRQQESPPTTCWCVSV
ncbi:MAG: hypothetical protein ACLR8Y_20450 [Alistipes indistinctus]